MGKTTPDNQEWQDFHDVGMNTIVCIEDCLTSCNKGKE